MKGQLSNLALAVVIAIAVLYVGLYMVTKVSLLQEKDVYNYAYSTASNTTAGNLTAATQQRNLTVALSTPIYGETAPTRTLFIKIDNKNTTTNASIEVFLQGTSQGTFTAINNSVTNHTFTLSSLTSGVKNVTVTSDIVGNTTVWLNQTSITYESSRSISGTDFGSVYTSLTTSTSTIFDVIILVIIIVALGVAIANLRDFGGVGATTTTI